MAARTPIRNTITSPTNGSALVGVSMTITKHVPGEELGKGEAATIYLGETTSEHTPSNVITSDSKGSFTQGSPNFLEYWLPVGRYDLKISGEGLATYYVVQDFLSGAAEGVPEELLAAEAVSESKIKNLAVTAAKLAAGAVTAAKLGAEAVGTAALAALSVTTAKIAEGAITAAKIAAGAVETGALAAESVTRPKLAKSAVPNPLYGDGSDGVVTFNGTNEYTSFAERSGTTYTLKRDVYATVLTVGSGVTILNHGYVMYGGEEINIAGTVKNDGGNGAAAGGAGTSGAAGTTGEMGGGGIGGNGTGSPTGANAFSGEAYGGAGGAGEGSGGTATPPTGGVRRSPISLIPEKVAGGGGGGGSLSKGSDTNGAGGGGGGGVVLLAARTITVTGEVKAVGGAGGEGSKKEASGSRAGGGGGGGAVILVYSYSSITGTVTAAGGAPGAKGLPTLGASAGEQGHVIEIAG